MEELMKNQIFATHAIAAAGSVTLGTVLTYPLDTIKVLIQVLDRVKTLSGNAGLCSGFGWLMLGRILGAGACFGTYEILTAFYKLYSSFYVQLEVIVFVLNIILCAVSKVPGNVDMVIFPNYVSELVFF
ncbi:hypothetical protein HYC85_003036 [Camellia sinensis]|uniref:Uncharacterized protein n=1 Tax=Camellia sinensis TaxID=4442 RepID=A0A7J7IB59_CAMSI|nr:hypothetical protein HYC85_003036 [Camellia sinensis]